jgi:peptide/nickel transport system permease protein
MSEVVVATEELGTLPVRERGERPPISVVLSAIFLFGVLICAIFGQWIAPYNPSTPDLLNGFAPVSSAHWLGTDDLGRDVFSRVIVGARTAITGPVLIAVGSMVLGAALGIMAGYVGGFTDTLISRWIDLMYSLPSLLVAIVVVGVLGGGYWIGVAVLLVLFVPFNARLVRAAALEQRSRPYVEAARMVGLSRRRIMARHIFPTTFPLIFATTVLNFAFALVSLSGLSFVGLGVAPGTADWGRMLAEGIPLLFQNPLVAVGPGLAIVITATCMNLMGDWAFEALNERSRTR